jgi:hypothetical protein
MSRLVMEAAGDGGAGLQALGAVLMFAAAVLVIRGVWLSGHEHQAVGAGPDEPGLSDHI